MSLTLLLMLVLVSNTTTTPPTPTNQEIRIGDSSSPSTGVTAPKLISYARPVYTDDARRRRIQGVVTVQAAFDIDGNFKVLRVIKGLGYGLDESALAALQKWRFTPAYNNGRRVSVVTQVDVEFSLFDPNRKNLEIRQRPEMM